MRIVEFYKKVRAGTPKVVRSPWIAHISEMLNLAHLARVRHWQKWLVAPETLSLIHTPPPHVFGVGVLLMKFKISFVFFAKLGIFLEHKTC